jgi:hypothetical protein
MAGKRKENWMPFWIWYNRQQKKVRRKKEIFSIKYIKAIRRSYIGIV